MGLRDVRFVLLVASSAVMACSSSSGSPDTASDASAQDGEIGDGGLRPPIKELNPTSDSSTSAVMCGATVCPPPVSTTFPLSACCLPGDVCGGMASGGGACIDLRPGTRDPACPSTTAMGFPLEGCCPVTGGFCALDISAAGLGCNPLSALSGLGMATATDAASPAAPPVPCSVGAGGEGGAATDASDGGTQDAGSE
jgi:hypothetical protein